MPFYEGDQRRESEILSFKICDRRASIPISEYSVKKRCLAILRCIQMMPDKAIILERPPILLPGKCRDAGDQKYKEISPGC